MDASQRRKPTLVVFHRSTISILRVEWQFALIRKLQGTSFIEIWNLSNRRNVLGFSYQYSEEYLNNVNPQPYHTTPFLIAGGFSIRF